MYYTQTHSQNTDIKVNYILPMYFHYFVEELQQHFTIDNGSPIPPLCQAKVGLGTGCLPLYLSAPTTDCHGDGSVYRCMHKLIYFLTRN